MIGSTWDGVLAAVRAPWLVRGPTLTQLLTDLPSAETVGVRAKFHSPDHASSRARQVTHVALHGVAVLARLPGGRWRNTCLFRAATECWILRRHGFPAAVRIGVASAGSGADRDILAHAWVECAGLHCRTAGHTDTAYARLTAAS